MKFNKVLSLLIATLFVVQSIAAKPEVIIFKNSSAHSKKICSQVQSYLNKRAKITIKGVATSSTITSVTATKPAAIVALDDVSARSIQRSGSNGIPVIIGTDTKNFNAFKSLGATFADKFTVDSALTLALNETSLNSVAFLYIQKERGTISRTASRCRARGITVQHIAIPDESEASITETLQNLSTTSSILYISWNKKLHSVLKNNTTLLNKVATNSKAIISTSGSIVSLFRNKAHVFSIQRDAATLSAYIAEATAKAINSGFSNSGSSRLFESAKLIRYIKRSGNVIGFSSEFGKRVHNRAISATSRIKQLPDPPKKLAQNTPEKPSPQIQSKAVKTESDTTQFDTSWAKAEQAKKKEQKTKKKIKQKKNPPKKVTIDTVYVTVTDDMTNIFSSISPSLKLTGVAKKGDTFSLIKKEGEYLCIKAWGKKGYIHSSSIEVKEVEVAVDSVGETVVTKAKMTPEQYLEEYLVIISIACSLCIIIIVSLILSLIRKKATRKKLLYGRSALLLSKKPQKVLISDNTGETTTLANFLKSLEVYLSPVTSLSSFQKYLAKHMPDLILVDWNMNHEIESIIKEQLSKYRLSSATTVLFYNVPDEDRTQLSSGFGQATIYLHDDFPSVEKVELILGEEKTAPLSKMKQNSDSHLYGVLGNSHLEEIIQLLGTSQKSGCLVVEDETPFAVIFFMNGFIVDATTRTGTKGIQAIFEALLLTEGSFNFILNRQTNAYTMQMSAMQLLMEWSQYQDHMLAQQ